MWRRRVGRGMVLGAGALWAVLAGAPDRARAAVRSAAAPPRFAIVIGNNRPEAPTATTLRYADDDAVSTNALLVEAGVDSVLLARLDDDTRRMHPEAATAGPPTAQAFDAAVSEVFARLRAAAARGAKPELLIFYSGHGDVAGGEGYVVLEDRRLTRTDLYDLLSRSPAARNHVFVDACKSYFFAFDRGPGGKRTSYSGAFLDGAGPASLDNVGFVLSTSSDRDSHEWERFQGGILSHELRSALRGGADADGDGGVTYAELGAFLATANRAIANPRFRPDFLVRAPGRHLGEEVLRWKGTASAIRLELPADVHVYVEDRRGDRLADVHPAVGAPITLHVPPDRPLFVRRNDEMAEATISVSGAAVVAWLEPRVPSVLSRGALNLALEQLFSDPFDRQDVELFARRDVGELGGGPAAPPAGRLAPRVAAGVALVGLVTGLALNAAAIMQYRSSAGASQQVIDAKNGTIHRLDVASLIAYGVGGAAGATWAWMHWHPQVGVDLTASRPGAAVEGVSFTVGASFP